MQIVQVCDGCSSRSFGPVLPIRPKFVLENPNDFQLIDPLKSSCKRKGSLFHFAPRSITTLPEGQRILLCAQVRRDSIGLNFTVSKALLCLPLGACNLASQEHRLLSQVGNDVADIVLKP